MTDPTFSFDPGDPVWIRPMRLDDVPGLIDLFRRCYGDSYGNRLFYDPPALAGAVRERTLRGVVAVAADGRLLGHTAITIRHAGARVCETGNTVVDPAARGQGLLRRLGAGLRERVVGDGFHGYVHYPTTAHPIMQRTSVGGRGREVGVMLGYVAETTDYRAVSTASGRLAATVVYQPFRALPSREVRVAQRHRRLLDELYADLGLARHVSVGDSVLPAGSSELRSTWQAQRGLLHLFVESARADLAERVASARNRHDPPVVHVDLSLDQEGLHAAVEALAAQGFVFCALLPEFAHTDVLRLQALRDPAPAVWHPALENPRARWLCAQMRGEADAREHQRPPDQPSSKP